jgi:hypothetical protein
MTRVMDASSLWDGPSTKRARLIPDVVFPVEERSTNEYSYTVSMYFLESTGEVVDRVHTTYPRASSPDFNLAKFCYTKTRDLVRQGTRACVG